MRHYLFAFVLSLIALVGIPASATAAPGERLTIPAGTIVHMRLENSVGSDISRVEQPVRAEIVQPIMVHGRTVIPSRSVAMGHVVAVRRAGHLKERSLVAVRFSEIVPRGEDERYPVRTRTVTAVGPSLAKRDAENIGIPAAAGAIIGGLIGGGKGAGIGAAAGGGAGTARLMMTRGKNVRMGRGTALAVRLAAPLSVEVPIRSARR